MALIKARPVAGDEKLGAEFVGMVQPFVYTRHAGGNVIQQMAVLKKRIEEEVVREGQLTRHVKLGIGGIREIEFIVQSFQVLRGARLAVLRERNTLRALPALVKTKTLTAEEAAKLADAYRFLRQVEHHLQMEMELQTHTIPDEEHALHRLARSLGFDSVKKFLAVQEAHTSAVRKIYESVLAGAGGGATKQEETLLASEEVAEGARRRGIRGCACGGEGGRKSLAGAGVRSRLGADERIVRTGVRDARCTGQRRWRIPTRRWPSSTSL